MKVAALYDIHGMPWALDAVLAEVDADAIVVGGDFLGGPYPQETLSTVRSLGATVVRGNAEDGQPRGFDAEVVSADGLAWAGSLPLTAELDGVLYCHATPTSNLPATTAATPDAVVSELFAGSTGTVVIGHTHHQFDRCIGELRLVNAGSVGMPYEDDVAAFWTLVEDGEPHFMRTVFDIERAVDAVRASGWPMSEEFVAENLLKAVSREEIIAAIEGSQ
jgi:predicted phosphodiesterase